MNTHTEVEVILFIACVLVWLGPALQASAKRQGSLLHPSFMVPGYVLFSMSVALSEHWFHWSGRGMFPGIRTETQILQASDRFYTLPLTIMLALGFVFHFGVWLGCRRVIPTAVDDIYARFPVRPLPPSRRAQFALTCVLWMTCCCFPYLIFDQGRGFFWTVALYACIPFFPFLSTLYAGRYGIVVFVIGLGLMLLFPSKGNFFYYCAPYVVFWGGRLFAGTAMAKVRRLAVLSCCAASVYYGTYYLIDRREERNSRQLFVEYIVLREYGFETFAILTNVVPMYGAPGGGTALTKEFFSLVPSVLLPFEKPRGGETIASVMAPDAAALPNAGFYRFFCFDAYYDFGIAGAVAYCFLFAYILATFYNWASRYTYRSRNLWPMLCYLPWPMYAQFWVNGVIPFGISFSCFASLAIFAVSQNHLQWFRRDYGVRNRRFRYQRGLSNARDSELKRVWVATPSERSIDRVTT